MLGVKARTVHAGTTLGGTQLEVHYAQVGRAGLDVPFEITVRHRGGFESDHVTLAVSSSYLEIFNRNSIDPQPASETSGRSRVIWTFDAPPGGTLVVSLDLQVQSGRHAGRDGTVAVLDDRGRAVATTSFKTWLAP